VPKPEPLGPVVDGFRIESTEYWYEWLDEKTGHIRMEYVGTKVTNTKRPQGVPKNADFCWGFELENLNSCSADAQIDVYMDGKIFYRAFFSNMEPGEIYVEPIEVAFGSHEYSIYLNKQLAVTVTLEQTIDSSSPISRNMYLGGTTYEIGSCTLGDLIAGGWQNDSRDISSTIRPGKAIDVLLEMDGEHLFVGVANLEAESCILYDCVVVRVQSDHTGDAYAGAVIGQTYNPQSEFFNEFLEYKDEYVHDWSYFKNGFSIDLAVDDNQRIESISMWTPLALS